MRGGPPSVAAAFFLLASILCAQDAIDRAARALDAGDPAIARTALLELLGEDTSERDRLVARSLSIFRDRGATDVWIEAAQRWLKAHQDDALMHFYLGVTFRDLKHLRRAEDALGRALALAPANPGVREAFAWNAALRFDSRAALARSEGAGFPGVEEFRSRQQARLDAEPAGTVVGLMALGLALLSGTLLAMRRLG